MDLKKEIYQNFLTLLYQKKAYDISLSTLLDKLKISKYYFYQHLGNREQFIHDFFYENLLKQVLPILSDKSDSLEFDLRRINSNIFNFFIDESKNIDIFSQNIQDERLSYYIKNCYLRILENFVKDEYQSQEQGKPTFFKLGYIALEALLVSLKTGYEVKFVLEY